MPTKLSRFSEGIMEAAWIAAIILIPVFFNVYSSRIFEPDKIALLRSLALVTVGAWVVKLVEDGKEGFRVHKRGPGAQPGSLWQTILHTPLLPQALVLALVYILASIFSVSPRTSLWGSYQRLQGTYTTLSYLVIFATLVATLRRRQQVERLITALILCSLPIAFYGFLQRYEIDPIPWGGNTQARIAANMGNSIFVAAYMIMVWPLTVIRVIEAFLAILRAEERLALQVVRATLYLTIALLQPIALYFSFSRGPVLGFAASTLFLFLLILMTVVANRRRRLVVVTTMLVLGLLGATGLLLMNIENGPLESLRKSPQIGRFGLLLNPESNSALVRKYIWEGAADLVAPHEPIEFPDGSTDRFNFLRPLIGYGPESMYVAYNPFYVPDLGHVEKRNASPDRSHNETWDALVITGALGLVAYLIVFVSVFYFGLKWLGLVESRTQKILFWSTTVVGGLVGSGLLIAWSGIEWFGLGLPFGIALGLAFVYLPLAAFTHYKLPETPEEVARTLLLIALLSAVLAHFLEINFGIAIAVTRTYFWVYAALLLLVGVILPRHGAYDIAAKSDEGDAEAAAGEASQAPDNKPARRRRTEKAPRRQVGGSMEPWLREALIGGLLLAVLMSTLGYNYVSNSNRQASITRVIGDSLSVLPNRNDITSYGILGLVSITIVLGGLLWASENPHVKDLKSWGRGLAVTMGAALGGMLFFWLWHAGVLVSLATFSPRNADELIEQVNRISSLLTNFYVWIFLLLLGLAYLFGSSQPARGRQGSKGLAVAAITLVVVALLVVRTNLRIIHADITFKMAEPFARGDTWSLASLLYTRAISLAPDEDYYYLFLGRSYLEQAKLLQSESEKAQLVAQAETDLLVAQEINPLNTDHTANLGRLYSWWAAQATTQDERVSRGEKSNNYYSRALTLSPQNSTLWGEWAILLLDVLNQPDVALQRLQHALTLDEAYNFTLGLMGDYYLRQAEAAQETGEKKASMEIALGYYDDAARYSTGLDAAGRGQYLVSAATVNLQIASLTTPPDPLYLNKALEAYSQALKTNLNADDRWRILEQMARVAVQTGDKTAALDYANQALQAAPEDQKERVNQLIAQIQALP